MGRSRAPSRAEIEEVRASEPGITLSALAERFGFTPGGMHKVLSRYEMDSPSPQHRRHAYELPWRLRTEDLQHYIPKLLRMAGQLRRGRQPAHTERWRANGLTRLVDKLNAAGAALTYDPDSINTGDDLWPWWAVSADESDRLVEIPGEIGTLRISLWHIPPSALSAEEAEALLRLKIKKGVQ